MECICSSAYKNSKMRSTVFFTVQNVWYECIIVLEICRVGINTRATCKNSMNQKSVEYFLYLHFFSTCLLSLMCRESASPYMQPVRNIKFQFCSPFVIFVVPSHWEGRRTKSMHLVDYCSKPLCSSWPCLQHTCWEGPLELTNCNPTYISIFVTSYKLKIKNTVNKE